MNSIWIPKIIVYLKKKNNNKNVSLNLRIFKILTLKR